MMMKKLKPQAPHLHMPLLKKKIHFYKLICICDSSFLKDGSPKYKLLAAPPTPKLDLPETLSGLSSQTTPTPSLARGWFLPVPQHRRGPKAWKEKGLKDHTAS